jgi:sulfide dehydrogenase [flavocytochrome c] flavoprotein subunit
MVAHMLKNMNPTAKILVADPKESFSKQGLFEDGWERHYPGMITRIGPDFGGGNVEVDPDAMTLTIDGVVENVDVCNVIPAQQAGLIAHAAGITDGNWAPVSAYDLSSRMDPRTSTSSATRPRRARCRNRASPPTARPRSAPTRSSRR